MGSAASHDVLDPAGSSILYESATATSSILNNVKSCNRPDGLAGVDEESPFWCLDGLRRTSYGERSVGGEVLVIESSCKNFSAKKFSDPRLTRQMDPFAEGGSLNAACNGSADIERVARESCEIAPYDISNDIVFVSGAGSAIGGPRANPAEGGAKNAPLGNRDNPRSPESFGIDTLIARNSSPIRRRWRVHRASICLQAYVSPLASHPLWVELECLSRIIFGPCSAVKRSGVTKSS
jgi:hypothetical protein